MVCGLEDSKKAWPPPTSWVPFVRTPPDEGGNIDLSVEGCLGKYYCLLGHRRHPGFKCQLGVWGTTVHPPRPQGQVKGGTWSRWVLIGDALQQEGKFRLGDKTPFTPMCCNTMFSHFMGMLKTALRKCSKKRRREGSSADSSLNPKSLPCTRPRSCDLHKNYMCFAPLRLYFAWGAVHLARANLLEGQEGQDECKHQDCSHVHELQTVLNGASSMQSTSLLLCSTLTLRPIAFVWFSSWPM